MVKRQFKILLFMSLLLVGCSSSTSMSSLSESSNSENNVEVTAVIVSKVKQNDAGRRYLEVMGNPFLPIGAQIRLDGLTNRGEGVNAPPANAPQAISLEQLHPYIVNAKNMGFNVLQIPVDWRRVETSYDVYDFSFLDQLLSVINAHNMKMEILWFSTNMCGDVHSFHLPDYIWQDSDTYPKMTSYNEGLPVNPYWSWMYGWVGYLVLDNPNLLMREAKVINKMMDHLFEWNKHNGEKCPVIGVQVHNESDGLLRWRHDQRSPHLDGQPVSKERLWQMTLNALNNAGLAFKDSKYKVVTRSNITVSLGIGGFPQAPFANPIDIYNLPGIDIIGDDPYVEDPLQVKSTIQNYTFDNNLPHIAENMGNYSSTPQLINAAYTSGGFYYIYDFATPPFFVWMKEFHGGTYQMDQGIVNYDFSEKEHSSLTSKLLKGIQSAHTLFLNEPISSIAMFNSNKKTIDLEKEATIIINNYQLNVKTSSGAIGFIIVKENKIYVFMSDDASIKINQQVVPYTQIGYFSNDHQFINQEKTYPSGQYLAIIKEKLNVFMVKD